MDDIEWAQGEREIPLPVNGGIRQLPKDTRSDAQVMADFYEKGFC